MLDLPTAVVGTRDRILAAAVEMFAAHGYGGTSVRQIAEKAGIQKGNLTYHFAVKEDLLYETIAGLHDAFVNLSKLWYRYPGEPARTVLERAARNHILLVCQEVKRTRISYENMRFLSAEKRNQIIDKREEYEHALQHLVREYMAPDPEAPDFIVMTRILLGMLNFPYHWYKIEGPVSPVALAEIVANAVLKMLGPGTDTHALSTSHSQALRLPTRLG
jgi:AcrR family transcriptional regulator